MIDPMNPELAAEIAAAVDALPAHVPVDTRDARRAFFSRPMPEGYAEELAAMLIAEPQAISAERGLGSHLVFRVGAAHFALTAAVVRSITPPPPLCRLPQYVDSPFLGLVSIAGEIIPCCSLGRMLGIPESMGNAPTRRLLVLEERPGELWAFHADEVLAVAQGTEHAASEDAEMSAEEAEHTDRADRNAAALPAEWRGTHFRTAEGTDAVVLEPARLFRVMAQAAA
jgi:chemotaxis signal transduction protein